LYFKQSNRNFFTDNLCELTDMLANITNI